MLFFRLILESFNFAGNSLKANKLRTFLSLLGITIGIFAIISVFTVIDSLEGYIRDSLNSLGNKMVYIQKWPWTLEEGESEYPWWKYINRSSPTIEEAEDILRKSQLTENAVFLFGYRGTVQYEGTTTENIELFATTFGLIDTWSLSINRGRYFTESESKSGAPLVVIGSELADQLFDGISPVGKEIKVNGHRLTIIGTYTKQGTDLFDTSMDNRVHISVSYAANMVDYKNTELGQTICAKAKPNADNDHFIAELVGIMRVVRGLKPMEENDFSMNEVSVVSTQFDAIFSIINIAGAIIGGFSILVGGFGIANIMFVSVKERTRHIGIQKSLGAKRYFILLEFIFEAIILSILGGIVGLCFVFLGTNLVSVFVDMAFSLTFGNIVLGLGVSGLIGLISGFLPALSAARLNPVTAINTV